MNWGSVIVFTFTLGVFIAGFALGRWSYLSKEIDRIDRSVGRLDDTRHEIQQIYAHIEKLEANQNETTWLERLETEAAELRKRVEKLDRWLSVWTRADQKICGVTEHEMLLLKLQYSSMRAYLEILDERLRIEKAKEQK